MTSINGMVDDHLSTLCFHNDSIIFVVKVRSFKQLKYVIDII